MWDAYGYQHRMNKICEGISTHSLTKLYSIFNSCVNIDVVLRINVFRSTSFYFNVNYWTRFKEKSRYFLFLDWLHVYQLGDRRYLLNVFEH